MYSEEKEERKRTTKYKRTNGTNYNKQQKKKGVINRMKRFVEGGAAEKTLMHYRWMIYLQETEKRKLCKDSIKKERGEG